MDTGDIKDGLFPEEFMEEMATNHLARWLTLSQVERAAIEFSLHGLPK